MQKMSAKFSERKLKTMVNSETIFKGLKLKTHRFTDSLKILGYMLTSNRIQLEN